MLKAMIPRQATLQRQSLAQWYPVVAVTGPRQSGWASCKPAIWFFCCHRTGDWFNALRKYEALRPPRSGLSTQPDQPPPRLAQWVWPDPTGSTPTRAVARGRITVGEWPKEVSEWVDRAWGMKYAFSV